MNRAVKIRIYPDKEQSVQIEKTIGCSRFIYNQMLADKISYYQKEKKMLRNTPAGYKKEYPWLKEVDSLALANAQLHLESAFRKFFREPSCGFPRYKSRKHSRNSYTTNAVNGNILLQDTHLKLPKMSAIKIKLHRQIPSEWKLKSVTISREPSGKYFASLLFCCENQTVEKRAAERFLGRIGYAAAQWKALEVYTQQGRRNIPDSHSTKANWRQQMGHLLDLHLLALGEQEEALRERRESIVGRVSRFGQHQSYVH